MVFLLQYDKINILYSNSAKFLAIQQSKLYLNKMLLLRFYDFHEFYDNSVEF